MGLVLESRDVQRILRKLLNDDDALVAVIASDLAFANRSGAALALMPAPMVATVGDEPDEDLVENYIEVANVLSRLVNEASRARVRIDPGLKVPPDQMQALVSACGCTAFHVDIEGYGVGDLAIYHG